MIRTLALVAAAIVFPAAAHAQPSFASGGPASEPELNVRIKGFRDRILLDTVGRWQPVPGTPRQNFRATLQVLDSLKIPVVWADSISGLIQHAGFVARSQLGGKSVSHSFRCGMGIAGDYADTWRVHVAYAIWLKPDGSNSQMKVSMVAGASDVEGVSKPAVQCGSTGWLEQSIAKIVGVKAIQ